MTQAEWELVQQIVAEAEKMYRPLQGAAGPKKCIEEIRRLLEELQNAHADHHNH